MLCLQSLECIINKKFIGRNCAFCSAALHRISIVLAFEGGLVFEKGILILRYLVHFFLALF